MSDQRNLSALPLRDALREQAGMRMTGLVEIARLRRETGDANDLADAAFILGAVDDFCKYVDSLRLTDYLIVYDEAGVVVDVVHEAPEGEDVTVFYTRELPRVSKIEFKRGQPE